MRLFLAWRISAIAEGVSYLLLLFIAMPLKYAYGMPEAVRLVGSLHGGLFVVFIALLAAVYTKNIMTLKQCVVAFIASVLPFGAFVFDHYIKQRVHAPVDA
jgi:integral membrane protein